MTRVRAAAAESRLVVTWQTLAILDVLTLDGLRASLDSALQQLEEAESELRREHVRSSLRVVKGGA